MPLTALRPRGPDAGTGALTSRAALSAGVTTARLWQNTADIHANRISRCDRGLASWLAWGLRAAGRSGPAWLVGSAALAIKPRGRWRRY